MATKVERNWLNRLKNNLNLLSDEDRSLAEQMDLPSNDVRTALKREMAKQIRDMRAKGLVYRTIVV